MPRRALIEKRPWLLASLLAATVYYVVRGDTLPDLYEWALKGAGVAFLAVYAFKHGKTGDSRAIAAVMAFGALGDILIEYRLEAGAASFLAGHVVAIALYLRRRREQLALSQTALALVMLCAIPVIAYFLPADRSAAWPVFGYSLALAGMTASAWTSRFNRYRVGIGGVLFAVSDLLIFARMGPLAGSMVPDVLIWPLYYFGQFLICVGVVGGSNKARSATFPHARAL